MKSLSKFFLDWIACHCSKPPVKYTSNGSSVPFQQTNVQLDLFGFIEIFNISKKINTHKDKNVIKNKND